MGRSRRPSKAASKAAATNKVMGRSTKNTTINALSVPEGLSTPPARKRVKRTIWEASSPTMANDQRTTRAKRVAFATTPIQTMPLAVPIPLRPVQIISSSPPAITTSISKELFTSVRKPVPANDVPPSSPVPQQVYLIYPFVKLLVNKHTKGTPIVQSTSNLTFSLLTLEEKLQPLYDAELAGVSPDISTIICVLKLRGKRIKDEHILEDFGFKSQEELIGRMDAIYQQAKTLVGVEIELHLEWKVHYNVKEKQKLIETTLSSLNGDNPGYDEVTPVGRKSRTDKLIENREKELMAFSEHGSRMHMLRKRWKCSSEDCRNIGSLCYVDISKEPPVHYVLEDTDLRAWAHLMDIQRGTVDEPPARVYQGLIEKGAFAYGPKNPSLVSKKLTLQGQQTQIRDMGDDIMSMMKQQMAMTMMMSSQQQQKETMREEARLRREDERLRREEQLEELERKMAYKKRGIELDLLLASSLASPEKEVQNTTKYKESSPIDPTDDDANIISDFFEWKLRRITNEKIKVLWQKAYSFIEENSWSLTDMKAMSDVQSSLYQTARDGGIVDGIVRNMRTEMAKYKALVRGELYV
jgi:hypothetical protein